MTTRVTSGDFLPQKWYPTYLSMATRTTCLPGCVEGYEVACSVHDEHDLADVAVVLHILVGSSRFDEWK